MQKRIVKRLSALLAVLMALTVLCTVATACTPSVAAGVATLGKPTYPKAVKAPGDNASQKEFDAWSEYNESRQKASEGNQKAMKAFYKKTLAQFLGKSNAAGTKSGKNAVYSPLNVYLALAMLTETVDGNSQKQLLGLLGEKDLTALRKRVDKLFTANYQDDGECTSLLANSLWLNQTLKYKQKTIDNLTKYHYASAFSGKPGTKEMDKALQGWINENTHDLLKDQAGNLKLDPSVVLALVSTIYYKAAWQEQFEDATRKETFHVPTGDKKVDMMHKVESLPYYNGKHFEAVALPLKYSGSMWFFLPKEGTTAADLASDSEALALLTDPATSQKATYPQVTLSLPQMDAVSDMDLIKGLKKLGVKDIFDPSLGDFSPLLSDASNTAVSQIEHAARVKTDEEGVEAAAFTAIIVSKSAMPTERILFTVDRPFYFGLTGYTGDLLFAGVVNDPAA